MNYNDGLYINQFINVKVIIYSRPVKAYNFINELVIISKPVYKLFMIPFSVVDNWKNKFLMEYGCSPSLRVN